MSGEMFTIQWPDDCVIRRMQEEIDSCIGEGTWESLDCRLKDDMDSAELNSAAYALLQKIDSQVTDEKKRNKIFSNIRHGLTKEHFVWARDIFLTYNDIDLFAQAIMQDALQNIKADIGKNHSCVGQPITLKVYSYLEGIEDFLYGKRQGNRITATMIPANTLNFLTAQDSVTKRYNLCHCPFAGESIKTDKTVSKTLCNCSMGHILMFWETALNTKLEGPC